MLKAMVIIGFLWCGSAFAQEPASPAFFASVVSLKEMKYPHSAYISHIRGAAVVRAKLDDDGKVTTASAIAGHPLLASEAVSNIQKWRFKPNPEKEVIMVYAFMVTDELCPDQKAVSLFDFKPPNLITISTCVLPPDTATGNK